MTSPSAHTPDGGVLVGSSGARRRLVVFEDAQCPFCARFEQASGDLLRRETASGNVAVEYRMRSFLGPESVRAAAALAAAAEADRFDDLRRLVFQEQPPEHSGGFTHDDLVALGARAGITDPAYADAVRTGRYEAWQASLDDALQEQDPDGTPQALLDGEWVDAEVLYDPERLGALLRG